jgi:hypothetical protein
MPDVSGVSGGGSTSGQPAADAWLSFESRMRRRCLDRCLLRADAAFAEGRIADAAAALDEARQLNIDSADIAPRAARLEALTSATPDAAPRSRRGMRLAAMAAGLLVVATGVAVGGRYWQSQPAPAARPVAEPVRAAAVPNPVAPASPPAIRLQIVRETITAPEFAPQVVTDEPRLPVQPGPPIAEPEPEPEPVVMAVNRGEANPPAPTTPEPRTEPRTDPPAEPVVPPPPILEPLNRPSLDPITLPASRTAPPAAPEPARVHDESTFVREVLEQYEEAYSSLDARAASAVWPGVDSGALSRAFDGLASQRVSLGSCDVTVNGPAARATCAGTATWEPKVGGGVRTEPRRWNFDLRKAGDAWRIERAIAR